MVLTAAGRRVLDTARRVLGDLERTEEDVRRLAGHGEGTIRVCTQCYTGYHWLAGVLATFQRKHPGVTINIAADATDRPVDALFDGRIDLAILIDPARDRRLRLRPLFTDEMVAIVAPSHELAKQRWVSPAVLAGEHLLVYSSAPEESFVLRRVMAPLSLTPRRVSFIMLTEAMTELARAGIGVGILPRWSAQRAIAAGAVVPLSITRRGHAAALGGGHTGRPCHPGVSRRVSRSRRRARPAGTQPADRLTLWLRLPPAPRLRRTRRGLADCQPEGCGCRGKFGALHASFRLKPEATD